ncbi:NADH-quinone oxidoreductase subunit C [Streptomyces sp. MAG02]|nr:NADH-quinone oxidoreductase subunit C [Streptomyces sp. MAG02]
MSDKPTPRGAAGGLDSGDRIPDGRNFLDPSHPDQVHTPAKGREWTDRRIDTRKGMWGATSGPGDTSGYGGIVRTVEISGNSERPYGGWFDEVADRMAELVPDFSDGLTVVDRGEITFFVRSEKLLELVEVLRDDDALRFESCTSLTCVHYPHMAGREMHVVYNLLSMTHNRRIRLEVALADPGQEDVARTGCSDVDSLPHVPSVVSVYPHADWQEREAWDMFGVIFDGHPALTRILMPDDWVGHPQRKDYPLGGIPIEYKGAVVPPPDQRRSYN